jgi:FkbM family methyltransferase
MVISRGDLREALKLIGQNKEARDIFLAALVQLEEHVKRLDFDVREQVTGPICDAVFADACEVQKTLANGTRFTARYTSKIIRDFLMAGPAPEFLWEPQTSKALLTLSAKAKNTLIGGAYIGDHAVLIGRQVAPTGGAVHCFEPSAESAALLATNCADNGLNNVHINQLGLWGTEERLVLTGEDSHASPRKAGGEENSFRAVTIDAYCGEKGIESLDLIQLDIEGGELEALRGATKKLAMSAKLAPTIVFEVHSSYLDWSDGLHNTEIVRFVKSFGYQVFAIRDYNGNEPMTGRPVELVPPETCYLEGPPHGFNMLALKDLAVVESGLFKVVNGVSPKLLKHKNPKLHAPIH